MSFFLILLNIHGMLHRKKSNEKETIFVGSEWWDNITLCSICSKNAKLVCDYHGLAEEEFAGKSGIVNKIKSKLAGRIDQVIYRRADAIIVPSVLFAGHLEAKFGERKNYQILPYLPADFSSNVKMLPYQNSSDVKKILFIGALKPEGGLLAFIENNLSIIKDKKIHLTVIGQGYDSEQVALLAAKFSNVSYNEKIERDLISKIIVEHDYLLAPEKKKLFSNLAPHMKIIDFLQYNRRVITYEHAWMRSHAQLGFAYLSDEGCFDVPACRRPELEGFEIEERVMFLKMLEDQAQKFDIRKNV